MGWSKAAHPGWPGMEKEVETGSVCTLADFSARCYSLGRGGLPHFSPLYWSSLELSSQTHLGGASLTPWVHLHPIKAAIGINHHNDLLGLKLRGNSVKRHAGMLVRMNIRRSDIGLHTSLVLSAGLPCSNPEPTDGWLGGTVLSSLDLRCFIYEKKIVVVIIIAISKGHW